MDVVSKSVQGESRSIDWDATYASLPRLWDTRPSPEIERLLRYAPKSGNALDVGAGEGRNSLALHAAGYTVQAIDSSEVACTRLKSMVEKLGVDVLVRHSDILLDPPVQNSFDVIVCDMVLQFLPQAAWGRIIDDLNRALTHNGVLYLRTFSEQDPSASSSNSRGIHCTTFDELEPLISQFELLARTDEYWLDDTHGPHHYHGTISLFLRNQHRLGTNLSSHF